MTLLKSLQLIYLAALNSDSGAISRSPKDGEVTEGNLGFPLFVYRVFGNPQGRHKDKGQRMLPYCR